VTLLLNRVLHERGYADRLLGDFSIKVTEMFRDPGFFQAFRSQVVPLLRGLPEIRIWHAGCATGEEVYSMSILLEEEGLAHKAKLYATDMNEAVIETAKRGAYPLKQMQMFTKNYLDAGGARSFSEYYTTDHQFAYFQPSLRENVMFAQHNLVTDRSFNEFHVIICRNVLIYFDSELQNRVHDLFYNSLSQGGFLGLGSKESIVLLQKTGVYEDFVSLERIYRKV
jgi:chemotaxis protein methyltransferase CheR